VPDLDFDNSEILNDVSMTYEYAFGDSDPGATVRVVDAASAREYDKASALTIDAPGVHSDLRGDTIAPRYVRAKMRNFREPNPIVPVSCHITKAVIEPGDVVSLTHAGVPDIRAGTQGISAKFMLVVGKRYGWSRGTVDLELVQTGYYGKRYGLIAPDTVADYTSATDEQKSKYCFISDDNGKMSNGDEGYLIA
jgi:hypothetical protein